MAEVPSTGITEILEIKLSQLKSEYLSVQQYGRSPNTGIPEILEIKLSQLKSESHAFTNKYPEAAAVIQVHIVLNDIEILARCTLAKVGESPKWTSIVNNAENRANFCKAVYGKPHFSTLYCMHTVTLNEL
jgi:hypothetical protein